MPTSDTMDEEKIEKEGKTTAVIGLVIIIVVLLMLIAAAAAFLLKGTGGAKKSKTADAAVTSYMDGLKEAYSLTTNGERLFIDGSPDTEEARQLYSYLKNNWSYSVNNSSTGKRTATSEVYITCTNTNLLAAALHEETEKVLEEMVEESVSKDEIYDADNNYLRDVLRTAYDKALERVLSNGEKYETTIAVYITEEKSLGGWTVTNAASPTNSLAGCAEQLREAAESNHSYISKKYTIDEKATAGNAPDPTCFGITDDPAVVSALLEEPYAKNLMKDAETVWNAEIVLFPGSKIRYYLDETILMIEWQEVEANAVGTFAEVFIADGSQIRRKIAGDSFLDMNFETPMEFAADTNAVLLTGGDMYNHGRSCGIVVYNREIYRFDNTSCDDCYITADGDMLFSYRNQFKTQEEAQKFVDDNNILYSLCFGPVLIDDGKDVTPEEYPWGEINDTYARAALGMLGEHHYLSMNINHGEGQYYNLATLRQATDAMLRRGCIKAYTLDGGQTASTVVNGQLINPVQFGTPKYMSDALYFATAVPSEG